MALSPAMKANRRAWRMRAMSASGEPTILLSNRSIAENAANGTDIGVLSVANGRGTYVFTITSDPDNVFTIDTDDLDKDGTLDYETATTHLVTIQADNSIDDPITKTFTINVIDIDEIAPTIQSLSPADDATGVAVASNLVATFSEPVQFGTGNITLFDSDDDTIEAFDVATEVGTGNGQVSIAGAVLTINPTASMEGSKGHYVQIAATAIDDLAGNSFAGIANKTTWSFTTADAVAPTVSSYSPADNATGVAIDATLVATFNETVTLGASGVITLKLTSDDSTIDSWDVAIDGGSGAGQVEVLSDDELTLHLTTDLDPSEEYYVIWDAGVVKDASNNNVAALSSTTTWSFTTTSGTSSEAQQFFDRITDPGATRKGYLETLIDGLVTDGIWTKLDALWMFAQDISGNALINLKSASFNATLVNAPTFTADQGYAGNGSSSYVRSNFVPSTAGGNYTQNSASGGIYIRTSRATSNAYCDMGHRSGNRFTIIPRWSDGHNYSTVNAGAESDLTAANAQGFHALSRTSNTEFLGYRNGTLVDTETSGSAALSTIEIFICAGNNAGSAADFSTDQIAAAFLGGGLDGTEVGNLSSRINAYMTSLGTNVY
jgi:methionine-rich copper-binding protein CopC